MRDWGQQADIKNGNIFDSASVAFLGRRFVTKNTLQNEFLKIVDFAASRVEAFPGVRFVPLHTALKLEAVRLYLR